MVCSFSLKVLSFSLKAQGQRQLGRRGELHGTTCFPASHGAVGLCEKEVDKQIKGSGLSSSNQVTTGDWLEAPLPAHSTFPTQGRASHCPFHWFLTGTLLFRTGVALTQGSVSWTSSFQLSQPVASSRFG